MVKELNKTNFDETLKSDLPVVVDFWASWCGPCQMMKPIFEEVGEELKDKAVFGKLSTETDPEVAGKYGVRSIPTFIVFKGGKEIDRLVGGAPKELFKKRVEELLAKEG